MPKPALTPEQIKSFEDKFKELINKEEKALKQWDGRFNWVLDKPKLDHVVKLFSPESKDKYFGLITKLASRSI